MRTDRTALAALLLAGLGWWVAVGVVTLMSSGVVLVVAAAYVVVFAPLLASDAVPVVPVLTAAWLTAVAGCGLLLASLDVEVGWVVLGGACYGTGAVVTWLGPAFLLLLLLDPDRRRVT